MGRRAWVQAVAGCLLVLAALTVAAWSPGGPRHVCVPTPWLTCDQSNTTYLQPTSPEENRP